MSIDVHNQGVGTAAGGRSASSHPHAVEGTPRVPTGFRESFEAQRLRIIAALGKCHEAGVLVGRVIQELPAIVSLPETLRFSDAFESSRAQDVTLVPETVRRLQEGIRELVRDNAEKAEALCETPQEKRDCKARFHRRFETNLQELIGKEQSACGAGAVALCDRIDAITGMLRAHYGDTLEEQLRDFEACGAALRSYIRRHSSEGGVGTFPIEVSPQKPGDTLMSLPPQEFFDLLSTTTVRLVKHLFANRTV